VSRLDDLVERTLSGGLPQRVDLERISDPQPAAFWRDGDLGLVLLLYRRRDRTVHVLIAAASSRPDGGWETLGEGGHGWADPDTPREFGQIGAFGTGDLQALPGTAPARAVRVEGRLGDLVVSCEVGQTLGAFVLGFPPAAAGPVHPTALDATGAPIASALGELPDYA
jgi:hypothetical protein